MLPTSRLIWIPLVALAACDVGSSASLGPDAGGGTDADPCDEDTLLACLCANGENGVAYCEDGAWSECECGWSSTFPRYRSEEHTSELQHYS